jgi:hypothetical protein
MYVSQTIFFLFWSSTQLVQVVMYINNWCIYCLTYFSVLILVCPYVEINQNCTFCSCIQTLMEIMLTNSYEIVIPYDAGSRHRSSYSPLKNEESGIMDEV